MDLDHVFMLVDPDGQDIAGLAAMGLVETYRRRHLGQGTENICYCFDNMFLECLWICDADEVRRRSIARTGLYERSKWRTEGTNPFGVAWREGGYASSFSVPTWAYRPPYLPPDLSIDVAVAGDDPRQPMMFKSPGIAPPADWPAERRGGLQRAAGLGKVLKVTLNMPGDTPASTALRALADATILEIGSAETSHASLTLDVERLDVSTPLVIRLPITTSS